MAGVGITIVYVAALWLVVHGYSGDLSGRCNTADGNSWTTILDYNDDRAKDDLPNEASEIAAGFESDSSFFIGLESLGALDFDEVSLCVFLSGTCQESCHTLSQTQVYGCHCAASSDLDTPVKKFIASLAGVCEYMECPEANRMAQDLPLIDWHARATNTWKPYMYQSPYHQENGKGVSWHLEGCGLTLQISGWHSSSPYPTPITREFGLWESGCLPGLNVDFDIFRVRVRKGGAALKTLTVTATETSETATATTATATATTTSSTTGMVFVDSAPQLGGLTALVAGVVVALREL